MKTICFELLPISLTWARRHASCRVLRATVSAFILVALFAGRVYAADPLTDALQKGLLAEEAHRDLDAAIAAYQSVLSQFGEQRKVAATAAFRLGECYRRLGKTAEAAVQFERVVREFSDQGPLVDLSRKYLAEAGTRATALPANVARGQPSPQEVKLLEEEIVLVEQLLAEKKRMQQNGRASSAEVIDIQRQMLPLRRRLPENADPARQQALIKEEMALVEELIAQGQKQVQVGAISSTELIPLRRDLLRLQRELLSAQEGPRFQTRLNTIVRRAESDDAITEEETKEIQRLERIIQNSPDLINGRRDGMTPLHHAANVGQLAVVRFLLENKADVHARTEPANQRGDTALHLAAGGGHKAILELLIQNGADVNARNGPGETPLFAAANRGYTAVAEVLLAQGADVNAASIDGLTPLHAAVNSGKPAMVELLLRHKSDINAQPGQRTPLMLAVLLKRLDMVELLLANQADPNRKTKDGSTPLTESVRQAASEMTELLLKHGADPNVLAISSSRLPGANPNERQSELAPIHFAAAKDDVALLRLLLEHGAEINLRDSLGRTAVVHAVGGRPAALKELLARGADPNIATAQGGTPLLMAMTGNPEIVELLLAHRANPNAPGQNGQFPLFNSMLSGHTTNAEKLLKAGADPNQKGPVGYTPLHIATGRGDRESVELLIAHKASVNAQDDSGNTALHYAALRGSKELVKLLLDHGADASQTNAAKETPLILGPQEVAPGWVVSQVGVYDTWGMPEKLMDSRITPPNQWPALSEIHSLLRQAAESKAAAPGE